MWALARSAPRIERLIGDIFQSRIVGFIVGFDLRLGGGVVRTCGGCVLSDHPWEADVPGETPEVPYWACADTFPAANAKPATSIEVLLIASPLASRLVAP